MAQGVGTNNCKLIDSDNNGTLDQYVATSNAADDNGICDRGDTVCSGGIADECCVSDKKKKAR